MKINKQHCLSILIFSLILLSFPQTLLSQGERIAVIFKFEGEVRIRHEGEWKTLTSVGNRIRNSSVYSDDTILTMPGSTADLVFNDNSRLEIKEDTTLAISMKQITDEERAQEGFIRKVAGIQKEVIRNIKLKAGGFWASVTPSKSVLTEFETPTGVASVRGTILTIEFTRGITSIASIDGLLDFVSAQNEMSAVFSPGDVVNISTPRPGNVNVDVEAGDGIDVNMGIGTANVGAGEGVGIEVIADQVTVSANGDITLETSKSTVTIEGGGSLEVIVNPDTLEIEVTAADGVTITTPEGTIPVNTETDLGTADVSDKDITAAIEAGAAPAVGAEEAEADGTTDEEIDAAIEEGAAPGAEGEPEPEPEPEPAPEPVSVPAPEQPTPEPASGSR